MEPLLTCVKCKQYFNDKYHSPHVLPCLHTCCSSCLTTIKPNLSVQCPVCGETFEALERGTNTFPVDHTRKHLVDCYVVQKKPVSILCDQCSENKARAISRCKECAEFLCITCAEAHQKTKLTKQHTVSPLENLQNSSIQDFHNKQTCQVSGHEGQQFSQFCCSKTCDRPICSLCAATEHTISTGHDVRNINDAYLESKRRIQNSLLDIKQTKDLAKNTVEKIQTEIQKLNHKENIVDSEVETVFRAHEDALAKRKAEVKENLGKICRNKKEILESQLDKIKSQTKKLEQVCKFSEDHISNSDASEFLQMKGHIEARAMALKKQTMETEPIVSGEVVFQRDSNKMSYSDYSKQIGYIWSTSAYLPHTRVQTFDILVGKEQSPIFITLYNYQNRPLKEPGIDIHVEIKDESGRLMRAVIKDCTDTELCYKAMFLPTRVGGYRAMIKIQGKQLKADGYYFQVIKGNEVKKPKVVKQKTKKRYPSVVQPSVQEDYKEQQSDLEHQDTQIENNGENEKLEVVSYHDIFCPDISMDKTRMHIQNEIIDEGKTMKNQKGRKSSGRNVAAAFKTYRGTIATKPLGKVGQYYFEVQIHFFIKRVLRQDLIFEVGISRKQEIDKNYTIDCNPHAWVVCARRCPICKTICLQAWHNGQRLYHTRIAEGYDPGTTVRTTYGFLLDSRNKQWLITDARNRKYLYRFRDVDVTKSLWPVFGAYNPDLVNVTLTLKDGSETAAELDSPFNN